MRNTVRLGALVRYTRGNEGYVFRCTHDGAYFTMTFAGRRFFSPYNQLEVVARMGDLGSYRSAK